jgi:4-diphosphocytidyl-2-C-methyl-D-erythritol kinase
MQLYSPAKLNLFLRIIRRRPDGYHELASLFQTIDLCDNLSLSLAETDTLTCNTPEIPTDASNLVLKASDLFRKKTGLKVGLKAHLDKKIPHQAGLGGGSSNAATTLWGLNQLCRNPATPAQLMAWAAEIGSDVAFFLSQGTAYCTGRGEVIDPLPPLKPETVWVVKPSEGLSTPDVYRRYDPVSVEQRDPESCLKSFHTPSPTYFNDLETPAFLLKPSLQILKEKLQQGFHTVLMSGSGTAFFCIGEGSPLHIEGITSYKVNFMTRQKDGWYEIV